MQINLELSPTDVEYFRKLLHDSANAAAARGLDEATVLTAGETLLREVEAAHAPHFIGQRMRSLRNMIMMMRDDEFALAPEFRGSVVSALSYFAEPQDLIPDTVPGIGFLDDAIMIELVRLELQHEIEAYEDFCKLRTEGTESEFTKPDVDGIDKKRLKLFERIRERRLNMNDYG
jgi:uncharacterized membrane protein YkvA (DUF1232 family)